MLDRIRTRPDLLMALLIAMIALFLVSALLLTMVPSLPYIKNY